MRSRRTCFSSFNKLRFEMILAVCGQSVYVLASLSDPYILISLFPSYPGFLPNHHGKEGKDYYGSMGKQKIEIRKLENQIARYVCFSNRRMGISIKVNKLATHCGAEVAILVYPPGERPYSFGNPAMNPVTDTFLSGGLVLADPSAPDPRHLSVIQGLNNQLMELSGQLDSEKKEGDE